MDDRRPTIADLVDVPGLDQTGGEETGRRRRGRRGQRTTAGPAVCPSCNRTFNTRAGLNVHRRRIAACNPSNQVNRISSLSIITVVFVWLLYALYSITRGISYGLLGIYFFSSCTPIKFHSSLAVVLIGLFETFGLVPLYRASTHFNRFARRLKEAYRSLSQV